MSVCVVSGTFLDPSSTGISGATVRFNIDTPVFDAGGSNVIGPKEISTTTATNGSWSLSITQGASGTITLDCPSDSSSGTVRYTFAVIIPALSTAAFSTVWADSQNIASATYPLQFAQIQGRVAVDQLPTDFSGVDFVIAAGALTTMTVDALTLMVDVSNASQTVRVPDATTLSVGDRVTITAYTPIGHNFTTNTVTVKNNSGTNIDSHGTPTIYWNETRTIILTDNSTVNGTWAMQAFSPSNDLSDNIYTQGNVVLWNGGTLEADYISSYANTTIAVSTPLVITGDGTLPQLALKSTVSQSPTNIQEWQAPDGTPITWVDSSGNVSTNDASVFAYNMSATANISAGTMSATTFTGALAGNATTATTATTAGNVSGTVTPAHGGTGLTTLTANNVILGNGTSNVTFVAPSTANNVLLSNGTTWTSAAAPTPNQAVTTKTANYTVTSTDDYLMGNTNAFTFTMPDCATNSGKIYRIEKIGSDTNAVSIARAGSDTFEGSASNLTLNVKGDSITLLSSGSTIWRIVACRKAPVISSNAAGSGTYTTPIGALYIRVAAVGPGGGGSGSANVSANAAAGAAGSADTTFGTSLIVASKGLGGTPAGGSSAGGNGGAATLGTGPVGFAIAGGSGMGLSLGLASGGQGGSSFLGGQGLGSNAAVAGGAAAVGSGSGGGAAGGVTGGYTGSSGGAGGYVDGIIYNPSATYSFVVGSGGAGGAAGTSGVAGGAGADGSIIVWAHFQ